KRAFALVYGGSGCCCFDHIIHFVARTGDVIKVKLQGDYCFLVRNVDGAQAPPQPLAPAQAPQWPLSGNCGDCRNYRRQGGPEPMLEYGNGREASGENIRRPTTIDSYLRLLMLRYGFGRAALLL